MVAMEKQLPMMANFGLLRSSQFRSNIFLFDVDVVVVVAVVVLVGVEVVDDSDDVDRVILFSCSEVVVTVVVSVVDMMVIRLGF